MTKRQVQPCTHGVDWVNGYCPVCCFLDTCDLIVGDSPLTELADYIRKHLLKYEAMEAVN